MTGETAVQSGRFSGAAGRLVRPAVARTPAATRTAVAMSGIAGPVRAEPFGVPAQGRGMAGVELADRGVGVAGRAAGGVWNGKHNY